MTYEIRKSMTKMLECLGPASEHIWLPVEDRPSGILIFHTDDCPSFSFSERHLSRQD